MPCLRPIGMAQLMAAAGLVLREQRRLVSGGQMA